MSDPLPPTSAPPPAVIARPVFPAFPASPLLELELPGVRRIDALLDLLIVLMATIVLPYVPGMLITPPADGTATPSVDVFVAVHKWCEAALALCLLTYFVLRHRISPAAFGLRADGMGWQLFGAAAGFVAVYLVLAATSSVVFLLYTLFPETQGDLKQRMEFANAMPIESLPLTIVLLISVAIHEEIIFRGLLLPYLRRVLGSWWAAVLVSALIFAALHVPEQGLLAGGIQILGIGIALSLIFILTRSLTAVVITHFAFDFCQFQLMRILPRLQEFQDQLNS